MSQKSPPMLDDLSSAPFGTRDRLGRTALIWAAWLHGPEEIRRCLDQGEDINTRDSCHWTPLMVAVRDGSIENVRFLLEQGADVGGVDIYDMTVLTMALEHQHDEIAQLLRDAGAQEPPLIVAARQTGINAIPFVRLPKKYRQDEQIRFWVGVIQLDKTPIPQTLWGTVRLHITSPDGTRKTTPGIWPRDGQVDGGWQGGAGLGSDTPAAGTYIVVYEFAGFQTVPVPLIVEPA